MAQLSPSRDVPLSVERDAGNQEMAQMVAHLQAPTNAPSMTSTTMPYVKYMSSHPVAAQRTSLLGSPIACFSVGGEKRVCVPQVVASILGNVALNKINQVLISLNVHTQLCDKWQLAALKAAGILQDNATECQLMTASDAHRLIVRCIDIDLTSAEHDDHVPADAIRVQHECFGVTKGRLIARLYTHRQSPCIVCDDCKKMFEPEHFVLHSHTEHLHRGTCHWGFDSSEWRNYIHMHDSLVGDASAQQRLEAMKAKFRDDDSMRLASVSGVCAPVRPKATIATASRKRMHTIEIKPTPQAKPYSTIAHGGMADQLMHTTTKLSRLSDPHTARNIDAATTLMAMRTQDLGKPMKQSLLSQLEMQMSKSPETGGGMDDLSALLCKHVPTLEGRVSIAAHVTSMQRMYEQVIAVLAPNIGPSMPSSMPSPRSLETRHPLLT